MAGSKSAEKPTIELFMHSLNQEFPVDKDKGALKRIAEFHKGRKGPYQDATGEAFDLDTNVITSREHVDLQGADSELSNIGAEGVPPGWSVQWIRNWHKIIRPKPKPKSLENGSLQRTPQRVLEMSHEREEDFGGLIFDRDWDRVYKVNHAGRALFKKIVSLYNSDQLDEYMLSKIKKGERKFFDFLVSVNFLVRPDNG